MFTLSIHRVPPLVCLTDVGRAFEARGVGCDRTVTPLGLFDAPPVSRLPFNDAAGASIGSRLTQEDPKHPSPEVSLLKRSLNQNNIKQV